LAECVLPRRREEIRRVLSLTFHRVTNRMEKNDRSLLIIEEVDSVERR